MNSPSKDTYLLRNSQDYAEITPLASNSTTSSPITNLGAGRTLVNRFLWFSVIASLNHALNYVVNSYATSLLDTQLAGIILGLSWSLNSVSGLTIATPVVRILGYKSAMIVSLWGYTIQIASLYLALVNPAQAWPIAIVGSTISGITSAVWWTAQGICFELTCQRILESMDVKPSHVTNTLSDIRASLSAYWTIIYQSSDILVFLVLSLFPYFMSIPISTVVLALTFLGGVTSLLGHTFSDMGEVCRPYSFDETLTAITAVPKHIAFDARALLLAPFVFGFGITTAMFAYYVNNEVVSNSLGKDVLGFVEAFSYFVATLSAYPFAFISKTFISGQHWIIQFGSLNFLLTGVLLLIFSNKDLGNLSKILALKGLYGLGRGVFEGNCRAVYAELFSGDDLSTAFSTQTLMAGFSGGICYFSYSVLSRSAIAGITIGNGVVAIVAYCILLSHDYTRPLSWKSVLCCDRPQRKSDSSANSPLLSDL